MIFAATVLAIVVHLWRRRSAELLTGRLVSVSLFYLLTIQWEPGSPFQVELRRSVFLLGAAYVHIMDIVEHENFAPGNAGAILFYDIAIPLLAIGLLVAHVRLGGMRPFPST